MDTSTNPRNEDVTLSVNNFEIVSVKNMCMCTNYFVLVAVYKKYTRYIEHNLET